MSKHASPAVIGGFVVSAVALLFIARLALSGGRLFRTTARIIVYFDDAVGGLRVGAPVKFRGIEIGTVKDLRISMTGVALDPQHVQIPVLLEIDQDRLRSQGADVDLRDPKTVQRLVGLGLRARLASESLVTGVRYVELDIRPDTPAHLARDATYPEIPSVRSVAEALPERVDHVLANLEHVDIAGLTDSMHDTVRSADDLLRSPHVTRAVENLDKITLELDRAASSLALAARDLRPAIAEAKDTLSSTRRAADRLSSRADTTLRDVSDTARSLHRLADQLARDPGSILRGGKQ